MKHKNRNKLHAKIFSKTIFSYYIIISVINTIIIVIF